MLFHMLLFGERIFYSRGIRSMILSILKTASSLVMIKARVSGIFELILAVIGRSPLSASVRFLIMIRDLGWRAG